MQRQAASRKQPQSIETCTNGFTAGRICMKPPIRRVCFSKSSVQHQTNDSQRTKPPRPPLSLRQPAFHQHSSTAVTAHSSVATGLSWSNESRGWVRGRYLTKRHPVINRTSSLVSGKSRLKWIMAISLEADLIRENSLPVRAERSCPWARVNWAEAARQGAAVPGSGRRQMQVPHEGVSL